MKRVLKGARAIRNTSSLKKSAASGSSKQLTGVVIEFEGFAETRLSDRKRLVSTLTTLLNALPETSVKAYKDEVALSILHSTGNRKYSIAGHGEYALYGTLALQAVHFLLTWLNTRGKQKIKIRTKHTTIEVPAHISMRKLEQVFEAIERREKHAAKNKTSKTQLPPEKIRGWITYGD